MKKNSVSTADVEEAALLSQAYRVVIVDGLFSNTLSSLENLPEGITITSLINSLKQIETQLGQQVDIEKAGLMRLIHC